MVSEFDDVSQIEAAAGATDIAQRLAAAAA